MRGSTRCGALIGAALFLAAMRCRGRPIAQSPAPDAAAFYAGKSVELEIGYSVGGGYDLYGRLLARHLGQHIPGNPTIVPKNMEGAGSLRLANYLYAAAPRDGTVIGTTARGIAFDPLLSQSGALYDSTKFSWLGSANNEVAVCVALKSVGRHQVRGSLHQAADHRLDRRRRRHLSVSGRGQCGARHQVQDRHRLSGRQ